MKWWNYLLYPFAGITWLILVYGVAKPWGWWEPEAGKYRE